MGSYLDSSKKIRKRKKNTSRKTHKNQKTLEKNKNRGIKMAEEIERTYIIPLRREWTRAPKYKRAKRAVHAIQNFLMRHMKSDNVKIGQFLNLELWKHGIRNPPSRIKITTRKDKEGEVYAELYGKPLPAKEEKKEKGIKEKVLETVGVKKEEKKEAPKEAVKEEAKKIAKESKTAIKTELKKLEEKTEKMKKERVEKK